VINDDTVSRLEVESVAGAANNQLAEDRHGDLLEQRHITYAPDYVINGGGLINVNAELHGWAPERARSKAGEIYDTIVRVFEIAREEGIPSYRAADRLAEQRIAATGGVRGDPLSPRAGGRRLEPRDRGAGAPPQRRERARPAGTVRERGGRHGDPAQVARHEVRGRAPRAARREDRLVIDRRAPLAKADP